MVWEKELHSLPTSWFGLPMEPMTSSSAVASYSASFNFNLEDTYVEWLSPSFPLSLYHIVPWDKLFLQTAQLVSVHGLCLKAAVTVHGGMSQIIQT